MVVRIRQWLAGILIVGLVGVEVELLLLEHYESAAQFVPVVLTALALAAVVWHLVHPGRVSFRAVMVLMILFVVASPIGVGLHFQGAAAFQRETDPAITHWELVKKVMRAKAPPLLAPGVMLQLGLTGLVYALFDFTSQGNKTP
jgi:hypothetical protein